MRACDRLEIKGQKGFGGVLKSHLIQFLEFSFQTKMSNNILKLTVSIHALRGANTFLVISDSFPRMLSFHIMISFPLLGINVILSLTKGTTAFIICKPFWSSIGFSIHLFLTPLKYFFHKILFWCRSISPRQPTNPHQRTHSMRRRGVNPLTF